MHRLTLALIALGVALGLAAPAHATVNFPGCGDFEFIAVNSFELPEALGLINGDILVLGTNPGKAKIGQKNVINGTVAARHIEVQTNAVVAVCRADTITGNGTCLNTITPFSAPAGCLTQPFPPGIVIPQMPQVCVPGTVALITSDQTLAPGCYQRIRVEKDVKLVLQTGPGIDYFVLGTFRTLSGATVQSDTPGVRASIIARDVITEPNIEWINLFVVQRAAAPPVHIFNDSILRNTLVVAPLGSVHPHTGVTLFNSALAGQTLLVEPITTVNDAPPEAVCVCPPGFAFRFTVCDPNVSCVEARDCVPIN